MDDLFKALTELDVDVVKDRRLPITLSTDAPQQIGRFFGDDYTRTLRHTSDSIDLSRITDVTLPAPFCLDHDHSFEGQVGAIDPTSVKLVNEGGVNKLKAVVIIADGEKGDQILADIQKGIRRGISVGARILKKEDSTDQQDNLVVDVVRWRPLEASLVPIPADPNCGIAKSLFQPTTERHLDKSATRVYNNNSDFALPEEKPVMSIAAEIQKTIESYDKSFQPALNKAALVALSSDNPTDTFTKLAADVVAAESAKLLETAQAQAAKITSDLTERQDAIDLAESTEKHARIDGDTSVVSVSAAVHTTEHVYSVSKAISQYQDGGTGTVDGLEKSIHDQLRETKINSNGLCISREAIGLNALRGMANSSNLVYDVLQNLEKNHRGMILQAQGATEGAGLIHDSLLPSLYVMALRANGGLLNWGPTILDGLVEDIDLPKQTGVTSTYWIDPNSLSDPTETNATFGELSLSMKTLAAYVAFTRKALKQSRPQVDILVSQDLIRSFAIGITNAGLFGTGTGNSPTGITSTTGVITKAVHDDRSAGVGAAETISPNLEEIVDLLGAVDDANALQGQGSQMWIMKGTRFATMRKTFIDAGSGERLGQIMPGGTMGSPTTAKLLEGYPVETYSEMPNNRIIFGSLHTMVIGFFGAMYEVREDVITSGGKKLRAFCDMDLLIRQPKTLAVLTA